MFAGMQFGHPIPSYLAITSERRFRGFVLRQALIYPARGAEFRGIDKYSALMKRLDRLQEVS
jgi:hypothetical protein